MCAFALLLLPAVVSAQAPIQLDPFAQATSALKRCPPIGPRLFTVEEMRTEAHARAERGTRCALEGTCEPGGAYKRDGEINEGARAAIAADKRLAGTSIYVTTSRKWVTLKGCVKMSGQRRAAVSIASKQAGVERVFDELMQLR